jgi:FkbM family methyltransferase
MKSSLLEALQSLFLRLGLRVEFDHPVRNVPKLFARKIADRGIRTVLDVGANAGQFAAQLRAEGYRGRIVSFEPVASAHAILTRVALPDPLWTVTSAMALGETEGRAEINVAQNLASSSLLPVLRRSVSAADISSHVAKEIVKVRRLDDVVAQEWEAPFAMKLDTQGFELHVLRGAPHTLAHTDVLVAEMSLVPLYEGAASFVDLYRFLEDAGFYCITLAQGFGDHHRHELLQVDGVFVRKV